MTAGFNRTIGRGATSGSLMQSITRIRFISPICGPARPTPGASYMVASMSAAARRSSSVISVTGSQRFFRRGSGCSRIGRVLMREDLGYPAGFRNKRLRALAAAGTFANVAPQPRNQHARLRLRRDHRPPWHPFLEMGHDGGALRRLAATTASRCGWPTWTSARRAACRTRSRPWPAMASTAISAMTRRYRAAIALVDADAARLAGRPGHDLHHPRPRQRHGALRRCLYQSRRWRGADDPGLSRLRPRHQSRRPPCRRMPAGQ